MTGYLLDAFIYLAAAVIAVPLAKRLGLGSVLGYLIAGVIIGPVIGLVGKETEALQHFAEFGVVMMLFLVGLELEPRMLWSMRNRLLGLGGLQVSVTAALFAAAGLGFGLPWQSAVAVGLLLSLSSTAIVLQTFSERGLSSTPGGRSAFSVLLFQDIAVIPMLALIPLLALPELAGGGASADHHGDGHGDISLVDGLSGWARALVVLAAIALVVAGGRYLSRPLFGFVARSGLREAFTAASLMLVIGVAVLMTLVGLSAALGTFLAGVVLANSEFRHELEANIEPFKGLLLGLFFITVGAGIDFGVLAGSPGTIIGLTLGVMLIKGLVLFGLAVLFKIRRSDGWLFTLSLAQAGEFGFVLLSFSLQESVLPRDLATILALVVGLSMFLTPLLFIAYDKLVTPRYVSTEDDREADAIDEHHPVIIAGIGRFGQIVNRLLQASGVQTVVLDRDVGQIENMAAVGFKTYYGDVSRSDLLHTAGIAEASLLVVAIDEQETAVQIVEAARHEFPDLKILARAFDRQHYYQLCDAGADVAVIETHHSALALGTAALEATGIHPFRAAQQRAAFDEVERRGHDGMYDAWQQESDGERFGKDYRERYMELHALLNTLMQRDRADGHTRTERGWTPPPKGYTDTIDEDSG
ncbi:MAG: monovalent cation:proton antiporter-2 (CPA2) family protein [Pseudomonadota bacterium]